MSKEETVNKYRDEYLATRTPAQAEKFYAKSIDRQYSTIMSWRHRMRQVDTKDSSAVEVIEHLRKVRPMINANKQFSEADAASVEAELQNIHNFLQEWRERRRAEEIRSLEAQQIEIARRLEQLRETGFNS